MIGHIYVRIERNTDRSKLNQVVVVFLGLPRFLFAGGSVASFAVPSPPDSVGLGCFGGRPRPRFGAEDSAPGSSSFFSYRKGKKNRTSSNATTHLGRSTTGSSGGGRGSRRRGRLILTAFWTAATAFYRRCRGLSRGRR